MESTSFGFMPVHGVTEAVLKFSSWAIIGKACMDLEEVLTNNQKYRLVDYKKTKSLTSRF